MNRLKVGTPLEFDTFMSAVIDGKSFARIKGYIDHAKSGANTKIVAGGTYDDSVGYFVQPTVVETTSTEDREGIQQKKTAVALLSLPFLGEILGPHSIAF